LVGCLRGISLFPEGLLGLPGPIIPIGNQTQRGGPTLGGKDGLLEGGAKQLLTKEYVRQAIAHIPLHILANVLKLEIREKSVKDICETDYNGNAGRFRN
jgi:hypothetical protein